MNEPETPSAVSSTQLVGRRWKAVINGRKATNGKRYSATYTGDILESDDDSTLYDVLRSLADHLETVNAEMEQPDSFQVTLAPPPNAALCRPADSEASAQKGQSK